MNQEKNGFTVIEIVLVLAIAGLVFLGAFIALPALWSSQRDAARKTNVMDFVSAVKTYQTNSNRGALPTSSFKSETFSWDIARSSTETGTWKAFIRDYISSDFQDPDKGSYNFTTVKCLRKDGAEASTGEYCKYGTFGDVNDPENTNINGDSEHMLYIIEHATCNGDLVIKTNSPRSIAVVQVLERGIRYCHNS